MKQYYTLLLLLVVLGLPSYGQQSKTTLKGIIVDEENKPLEFVTVKLNYQDRVSYTDKNGAFFFVIDARNITGVNLIANMVGKRSIDTLISILSFDKPINLTLDNLSLSLKEVQVSAVRKATGLSNSSILFDRQAIEQSQAFSLVDILNNLPGKQYSALDLQSPKNLTLRTDATGNAAMNNALGTAIIIDGLAQSNNANMQNKNIGTYGLGSSVINDYKNGKSYDVTFGGIDLREIPADNIESIEVISGVAPAQYGDLTDGAVIINRQAGKTNYQFNTRINGGSTNFSLSKGYNLGKQNGFLNFNINYLISNNDPRDNMKKYDRVSGGLMYTRYFAKKIKNTFSVDYSEKLDDAKKDPDDGRDLMTYSKNRRISFSNRTSIELNNAYLRRISFNLGADFGYQDTYSQWYLNGNPKPMANKDTTGVYEGFYIPGTYTAIDQVVGKPKNYNGNVSFLSEFNTGKLKHFLSYGGSFSISSNKGQGVLYDPNHPRFANSGNKNERPYDFQLLPTIINTGVYLEDKFKFDLFKRNFGITAGLRYDSQNGYGNLQPRINASYSLFKNVKLNMAYGISTKSPTLAYRYPGPTYFDIPLINYYTGDVRNSLLLVYTYKYLPDNQNLRPSKSSQAEIGLSYDNKFFSTSVYAYYKNNTNGFNAQTTYFPLKVPEYKYVEVPGGKPTYYPTGNYTDKAGLSASVIGNGTSSKTSGIELFISTKKIKAIQTSFSFNSTYIYTDFFNSSNAVYMADEASIIAGKKAWYGVYRPLNNKNTLATSKINSDTHIPKLGFVVSLYYDYTWATNRKTLNDGLYPIAYIDKNSNYYPIQNYDPSNADYNHLPKLTYVNGMAKLPFGYGNLSMRLSKELKNKLRFSVNAYNVLNLKTEYYDELSKTRYVYNDPISIGAEISIKF